VFQRLYRKQKNRLLLCHWTVPRLLVNCVSLENARAGWSVNKIYSSVQMVTKLRDTDGVEGKQYLSSSVVGNYVTYHVMKSSQHMWILDDFEHVWRNASIILGTWLALIYLSHVYVMWFSCRTFTLPGLVVRLLLPIDHVTFTFIYFFNVIYFLTEHVNPCTLNVGYTFGCFKPCRGHKYDTIRGAYDRTLARQWLVW